LHDALPISGETADAAVETNGVVLVARRRRVVRVLDEVDLPDREVVRIDPLEDGDAVRLPRIPLGPDERSVFIPTRGETAAIRIAVEGDIGRRRFDVGARGRVVVEYRVGKFIALLPIDWPRVCKAPVPRTHDLRVRLAQRAEVRRDRIQLRRRAGELRLCGESRNRPRRASAPDFLDLPPRAEDEHTTPKLLNAQLWHVVVRVRGSDLREGRTAVWMNADGVRGEDEKVRLVLRDVQRKQLHVRAGGTGRDVPKPRPKHGGAVLVNDEVVAAAESVVILREVGAAPQRGGEFARREARLPKLSHQNARTVRKMLSGSLSGRCSPTAWAFAHSMIWRKRLLALLAKRVAASSSLAREIARSPASFHASASTNNG